MKKKSLLFLSICAWALQSHLVHANTLTETTSTVSQGNEISESSATTKATSSVTAESTVQAEQTVETDAATNNQVVVAASSSAETGSQTQTSLVTPASTAQNQSASTTSADTVATATSKTEIAFAKSPVQTETSSASNEPTGTVSVVNVNTQKGSYDVKVTNVSSPKEITNVYVPTWTEANGQDDIIWHEAKRQLDGSYLLNVNKSQHKYDSGKYHSHVYYRTIDGSLTGIGATSVILPEVKPSGTITIENRNDATGTFDVRVTNIVSPKDVASVLLPTWSQVGGYDDLRWYEATRQTDGSYKLTVNKKDHKYRTGNYDVHLYYKDSTGGLTGVGGTTTHLSEVKPSGTITIENRNDVTGTFDVRVTNIVSPKDVASVLLPTWSQVGGYDDLRWYEATRQTDGSYKLTVNKKDHKYRTGNYVVHLYYKDSTGGLTGVGGTTTHLSEVKPSGTITIENRNDVTGTFDVRVTNIVSPKDVASVLLPTWSQVGGYDDLRWYEATRQTDGSYKLTVNKKDHKYRTGNYDVHLYYKDSTGGLTGVGGTTTNLREVKPSGTITIENRNDVTGTFDVRVTNIVSPKDVASVLLPTWSQVGGYDDLRWYEATRQTDGSYKLTVNKKDHKYRTGNYDVHLYYKDSTGGLTGVGGTTTNLREVKPTAKMKISNINHESGTFEVIVNNITSEIGIESVTVPVWTEKNNQDDLHWYEAKLQSNGEYKAVVNVRNHKYEGGTYIAHLYLKDKNGQNWGIAATEAEINYVAQRSYTVYLDPGHGGIDSGASYGGVHEKDLAMSVANKLKDTLLQRGINVLMTRNADYNVDFVTERSRMANESNADLFVSIHFNASGAGVTTAKGIETYWYQPYDAYPSKINQAKHADPVRLAESEILANKVQSNLISATGAVDRGILRRTFAVLRETAIPAILVELGYMDNPSELQTIKQSSYHDKLAAGLAKGIMDWYGAVEGK